MTINTITAQISLLLTPDIMDLFTVLSPLVSSLLAGCIQVYAMLSNTIICAIGHPLSVATIFQISHLAASSPVTILICFVDPALKFQEAVMNISVTSESPYHYPHQNWANYKKDRKVSGGVLKANFLY